MVIYIDIDSTICTTPSTDADSLDYTQAVPWLDKIEKANKWYDEGHTIVYWTARGAITGKDWKQVTTDQLHAWGVRYHLLRFDKPFYDLFIDDKNINSQDW